VLVELPCSALSLRQLRAAVHEWLSEQGVSKRQAADIVLCVNELAANAIGDDNPATALRVEGTAGDAQVVFVVRDGGPARTKLLAERDGRLGVAIVEAIADEFEVATDDRGATATIRCALAV
jgi:anti-sigma regulatory factor (Ser/Thr protein kinase)